jgi:hypothetical protein
MMIDVLAAYCLTPYVDSKFSQCGGIIIVSPPEQLKTSMLGCLAGIAGVKSLSDLHTQELNRLRDDICAKKIRVLVFLDFQKIFERRAETSQNILGNLRALIDEGYQGMEPGVPEGLDASVRAGMIMAITPSSERSHRDEWIRNGFARRLLYCSVILKNPLAVTEAVIKHEPLGIGAKNVFPPVTGVIPWTATPEESEFLFRLIRDQHGRQLPLIVLQKILCVLRWNCRRMHAKDTAMETITEFANTLQKGGAEMEIDV